MAQQFQCHFSALLLKPTRHGDGLTGNRCKDGSQTRWRQRKNDPSKPSVVLGNQRKSRQKEAWSPDFWEDVVLWRSFQVQSAGAQMILTWARKAVSTNTHIRHSRTQEASSRVSIARLQLFYPPPPTSKHWTMKIQINKATLACVWLPGYSFVAR